MSKCKSKVGKNENDEQITLSIEGAPPSPPLAPPAGRRRRRSWTGVGVGGAVPDPDESGSLRRGNEEMEGFSKSPEVKKGQVRG